MTAVLLTMHLMIAAGLIVVILLQRSEGGGLGIGGGAGGGMGGMFAPGMGLGKGGITKFLRGGGLLGAGIGALGAGKDLFDGESSNNAAAVGALAGTALGAFFGPLGMLAGGMIGGKVGPIISDLPVSYTHLTLPTNREV